MMRITLGLLAAVVLSACGGPGSMNGTVAGVELPVKDAMFAIIKDQQGKSAGMYLVMADKPDLCATVKANRQPKNLTALLFSMVRYSVTMGNVEVLAPDVGDYTVIKSSPQSGGNYAGAFFTHTDANCTSTLSSDATQASSGLIKLKSLKAEAGGSAAGDFDVTFGAGDKVTGSFNASFCDVTMLQTTPSCE